MPKYYFSFTIFLAFICMCTYGQKKILIAKPTIENINIDGKIEEESWKTAPIASEFIMFEPDNGIPISNSKTTEVKVLYDNTALYISALLYDDQPNEISKELTNRDVFGNSDVFSVSINGFNDGQQDYRFYISAAGVQSDCIATEGSEDYSWDAIWFSKVKLTNVGWTVEMKIPYAAIRFSKAKKQTWGLNFMREIKRDYQKYTWNHVDTKIKSEITQEGILEGIENIKTPTRLFFIPYISAYHQQDNSGSDQTFKAGLDIKYGINDAFTLDAILVPDFGQTKFDNAILNLEPFEQQLNENRPFFTESTDLFTKGNLFYSRRIGGTPTMYPVTGTKEVITKYPNTVNLINAVKISGRTENGLGIGFMNAITEKTYATILNTDTNVTRKEVIQPLTNYNIFVLDKRFNQNSSVSFINTNTFRGGEFRDANVSAVLFDLNTKTNKYNLSGDFKYSEINDVENSNGIKTQLGFAKTRGKYRYALSAKYLSKNYDTNDLGILFINNYKNAFAETSYRIVNPTKMFNTFRAYQNINIDLENTTNKLQEAWYQTTFNATTLKNHSINLSFQLNPFVKYDFYEPRTPGKYSFIPKSFYIYGGFSSNVNKSFNYYIEGSVTEFDEDKRATSYLNAGAIYRFNNKLSVGIGQQYWLKTNDRGWVGFENASIIFAERNREIIQSDFEGKYAISNKMTINLTARYYWSYAENHEFLTLQDDGHLLPNSSYALNKNRNLNSWNFDLSYSWWFAPGSEFVVLYRNFALEDTKFVEKNIGTNFSNVLNNNLTNILSVSLRYYIDYNSLKRKH
ncbi:DUF5916 domain-containing protein [Flavobacterium cellulosilyticum]|uniref:Hydrolase n=1 Tax=Flavobacterium cellulosilyticum TaxID=2541731 RepID=A0A4R5C620_9FLAO|nr:DUF5916 domain-containing protein [Flavobacterium cellulosilyticum]TDD93986.1 hydrolase [Flavobacterium cellulosilyticum]